MPSPSSSRSAFFGYSIAPGPLTILSARTELSYFHHRQPLLIRRELRALQRSAARPYLSPLNDPHTDWVLGPAVLATNAGTTRRTPTPGPSRPSRQATPGPSDRPEEPSYSCRKCLRSVRNVRLVISDDEGDADALEDDSDDEVVEEAAKQHEITKLAEPDADGLISKPDGEIGRLKRGYSLKIVLGWDSAMYKSVKATVNTDVGNYLSHALSASNQPSGSVEGLTKLILSKYPSIAAKYRDGWPITDFIHLRLKYTSGRIANKHIVPQGKEYPKSLKKALKHIERAGEKARNRRKEKQPAMGDSSDDTDSDV